MKLSIFSRLAVGYLSLLVLVAAVSIYAILQMGQVRRVTHSIISIDNYLMDVQNKLTDIFLSETRYEKKYIIMKDKTLYEGFVRTAGDFEQNLGEAILLTDSPEIRELLARIKHFHERYKTLFDEEAEFVKTGMKYPKPEYAKEKEKIADDIINELRTLKTSSQKNIFRKIRDLGEAGTRARTVAITFTLTSLLFGIVLSILITRSITLPLAEMKKKTKEISSGRFEANLDLPAPPEIGELAAAFNLMCRKLKEVDKMKSDFFSLMSHELRTPLTSIKEGTNLMLEGLAGDITDKQKKLLTILSEESNRLIGLVNSLLDLSKMEAGMLAYNFASTELPPLIQKVIFEVLPIAESKNIRVDKKIEKLPPLKMDTERVLQALRNLIGNALKFTPPGGSVEVSARLIQNTVEVSVADSGIGIPKEHLATIFDKFQQVRHPGHGRHAGTGLGLAIVRHIINAHGGKVWLESNVGKGSTFFFALPV